MNRIPSVIISVISTFMEQTKDIRNWAYVNKYHLDAAQKEGWIFHVSKKIKHNDNQDLYIELREHFAIIVSHEYCGCIGPHLKKNNVDYPHFASFDGFPNDIFPEYDGSHMRWREDKRNDTIAIQVDFELSFKKNEEEEKKLVVIKSKSQKKEMIDEVPITEQIPPPATNDGLQHPRLKKNKKRNSRNHKKNMFPSPSSSNVVKHEEKNEKEWKNLHEFHDIRRMECKLVDEQDDNDASSPPFIIIQKNDQTNEIQYIHFGSLSKELRFKMTYKNKKPYGKWMACEELRYGSLMEVCTCHNGKKEGECKIISVERSEIELTRGMFHNGKKENLWKNLYFFDGYVENPDTKVRLFEEYYVNDLMQKKVEIGDHEKKYNEYLFWCETAMVDKDTECLLDFLSDPEHYFNLYFHTK